MINAGVRPGKIIRVRSKRDAKKRREEIAKEHNTLRAEGRFVFFDEGDEPRHQPAEPKKRIRERLHHNDHLLDDVVALESPHFVDDPDEPVGASTDGDGSDDWLAMLDLEVEKPAVPTMEELYSVPNAPAMERLEQLRATTEREPVFVPLDPSATVIQPMTDSERPTSFDEVDPFAVDASPASAPVASAPVAAAPRAPEPSPPLVTPPPILQAPEPSPPMVQAPRPAMPTPRPMPTNTPAPAPVPPAMKPAATPAAVPAALDVPPAFRPKAPKPAPTRRVDDAAPAADEVDERGAWIPPALRGVSS
ncbi:MAG: hypothetical protein R2706_18675 [Acidimicrobiales bacterium]